MKNAKTKTRSVKWVGLFLTLSTVCLMNQSAQATLTLAQTATSAKGFDLEFEAQLAALGDSLTIELLNNSLKSLNPDDDPSAYSLDIASEGVQSAWVYGSASGQVHRVEGVSENPVYEYADLESVAMFESLWQYPEFGTEIQSLQLLTQLADSASKQPAAAE